MTPSIRAGDNIATKVPAERYQRTVAFYRDVIGLPVVTEGVTDSTVSDYCGFQFGDKVLWLDKVAHASHPEIWLELHTEDVDSAAAALVAAGATIIDAIEPLGDLDAHWICDPAGSVILLKNATAP